jgi:hypothetical protein
MLFLVFTSTIGERWNGKQGKAKEIKLKGARVIS